MSKPTPPDLSQFWESIYNHLQRYIANHVEAQLSNDAFLQQVRDRFQIEDLVEEQIEKKAYTGGSAEITALLQVVSLLEERTREQTEQIQYLTERLEKLEEENLQTRIDAAKHHLDSMEKLALLQQKLNTRQ